MGRANAALFWIVSAAAYLLFASKVTAAEAVAAAIAATASTLLLAAAGRAAPRFQHPTGLAGFLAKAVGPIPRDCAAVGCEMVRIVFARGAPAGAFERSSHPPYSGRAGRARCALDIAALSLPPNSFVAGVDDRSFLTHRFAAPQGGKPQ